MLSCNSNWTIRIVSVIVIHKKNDSFPNWTRKALESMRKSFYHFLMKYRHPAPKDDISAFANSAFLDHGFPKTSEDYHQISSYLEMHGQYLKSMSVFDEAWEHYLSDES